MATEMANDVWFRFFTSDWQSATARMFNDERGAYLNLILDYYKSGPLPNDPERIRAIAQTTLQDWQRVWGAISQKFDLESDGKLHNKKCDSEITWRDARHAQKVEASRLGVAARVAIQQPSGQPHGKPDGEPACLQNQNQNQSTDTESREGASPSTKFKKPTLEELKLHCAKVGLPEIEATKFLNHYESNGWRIGGKTAMKSWVHAMGNWKLRWEESKATNPMSYAEREEETFMVGNVKMFRQKAGNF